MGWSVDNKVFQVERIFRKQKRRVKLTRPESPYPQVYISYEGKRVSVEVMDEVIALFPDFVCIHFVPEYLFPAETVVNQTAGSNTGVVKLEGTASEPARSNTFTA